MPEDPVLARLFPTAYPDDEDAAAEFRRFTESGLRDGKAAASGLVIDGLEDAGLPPELTEEGLMIDVELTEADAETWMRSFTDIRLALATRLGVEDGDEDYWHSLPDDDPRAQAHDIYEWVGWLQETIIEALTEPVSPIPDFVVEIRDHDRRPPALAARRHRRDHPRRRTRAPGQAVRQRRLDAGHRHRRPGRGAGRRRCPRGAGGDRRPRAGGPARGDGGAARDHARQRRPRGLPRPDLRLHLAGRRGPRRRRRVHRRALVAARRPASRCPS